MARLGIYCTVFVFLFSHRAAADVPKSVDSLTEQTWLNFCRNRYRGGAYTENASNRFVKLSTFNRLNAQHVKQQLLIISS